MSLTFRKSPRGSFARRYNAAMQTRDRMIRIGAVGAFAGALLLADQIPPAERHLLGAILFFGGLLILIAGFLALRDH